MPDPNVHTVPHGDGWVNELEDSTSEHRFPLTFAASVEDANTNASTVQQWAASYAALKPLA